MAGVRVHVVFPRELVERVDAVRPSGVSRGGFVRGAVEQALAVDDDAEVTGVAIRPSSASPDAPRPAPAEQSGSKFLPEEWREPVEEMARRQDEQAAVLSRSYLSSGSAKRGVGPVPKKKG